MSNKLTVFICIIALSATLALGGFPARTTLSGWAQDATPKPEGAPASGGSGGTPPATEKPAPAPVQEISVAIAGPQIGSFLKYIADREKKLIMYDDNANALKTQTINIIP